MKPLTKGMTCIGAIFLAAGSTPLRSQAWAPPTATQVATPTHPLRHDGKDSILVGHTWSNWTWVDPEGVRHVFPGTSSANRRMIAINGVGMFPLAGGALEYMDLNLVQALDGAPIYLSTENGGKGKITIRSQAYPKYKVLSVIYAPPGIGGTVSYGKGSGVGTTSSISQTFSNAFNLSASLVGGDPRNFATLGAGWSTSTTDSRSITMSNNLSTQNRWTGTSEGINHDQDILEIWLNPAVELSFTSSKEASWRLMNHPGDPISATVGANIVHLTVAQLLGKEPITNEHLLARLKREWPGGGALTGPGTDSDFHAIAKQNPYHAIGADFTGNTFLPDPNRFSLTNLRSVDYTPASGAVHTSSLMVQNEGLEAKGTSTVSSYSVSAAMGAGLTKLFGITATKSWTWTDEISTSRTISESAHAELSVPQPGSEWRGPTHIAVYTDTLYGSFLFTYLK